MQRLQQLKGGCVTSRVLFGVHVLVPSLLEHSFELDDCDGVKPFVSEAAWKQYVPEVSKLAKLRMRLLKPRRKTLDVPWMGLAILHLHTEAKGNTFLNALMKASCRTHSTAQRLRQSCQLKEVLVEWSTCGT